MQYELYSRDEQNDLYYHITTNDIKTILFYMFNDDCNHQFIIIDNYDVSPINYRILGFKEKPTQEEHEQLIFECKQQKYIDFYMEQGFEKEKICNLAINSAKEETNFYFIRINEFLDDYY